MQSSIPTDRSVPPSPRKTKKSNKSALMFLIFWIFFIGVGAFSAYLYSQHMKAQMVSEIQAATNQQLSKVQADYAAKMKAMNDEINTLKSKVESFNELLTFTKDNANNKTDNSNKLYTQLNEVKQKLDALQKKMDLLK